MGHQRNSRTLAAVGDGLVDCPRRRAIIAQLNERLLQVAHLCVRDEMRGDPRGVKLPTFQPRAGEPKVLTDIAWQAGQEVAAANVREESDADLPAEPARDPCHLRSFYAGLWGQMMN